MNPDIQTEKRWNTWTRAGAFCAVIFTLSICFWVVWGTVSHWRQGKAQDFSRCAASCIEVEYWYEDGKRVWRNDSTPGQVSSCQDRCYQLVTGEESP